MQIIITLTNYGNSVGPFNIGYNTTGSFVGNITITAASASLDELIAGKEVYVDDFSYYVQLENLDPYGGNNTVRYNFILPSPSVTPSVTVTPSIIES